MGKGRKRKAGPRGRTGRLQGWKVEKKADRETPAQYILERRRMFGGIAEATKGGEIDSEICDGIGQMCALGLLDGHGHDPIELRDKGRFWGGHYAILMRSSAARISSYERKDRTSGGASALTGADLLFDRMDQNLPSYERAVLLSLLVDPLIGHGTMACWAQSLIDEALLERGRVPRMMRFPTLDDREKLRACIRGLAVLVDGSLPSRRAA